MFYFSVSWKHTGNKWQDDFKGIVMSSRSHTSTSYKIVHFMEDFMVLKKWQPAILHRWIFE